MEPNEEKIDIPLPDGALTSNIRMPFIVCVNKCDLQSSVLREESANKILYILYHLRQYCIKCSCFVIQMAAPSSIHPSKITPT